MKIYRTKAQIFDRCFCCVVAAESEKQAYEILKENNLQNFYHTNKWEDISDIHYDKPDKPSLLGEYLL